MFNKSIVLKVIYLLSAALLFDKASFGQLSISNTTAEEAANYLVGEGVTVSNASFTGNSLQLAKFSNGNDYLEFNDGVILTTGKSSYAGERYTSEYANSRPLNGGITNDPDLSLLPNRWKFLWQPGGGYEIFSDQQLTGVAALEFDVTTTTGTLLELEFLFASMQYNHAPMYGDDFDVFGIFVSGPGINGNFSNNAKNLALVPNREVPVSWCTINCKDETPWGPEYDNCEYCVNHKWNIDDQPLVGQYNLLRDFIYEGSSKAITGSIPVRCNETYHVRVAISNTKDKKQDSAVMLKRGSIRTGFNLSQVTTSNQTFCEGEDINLSVSGENSWHYAWSDGQSGNGLSSITTAADPNNTTYTVTATNSDNCSLTKNVNVEVHPSDNLKPYSKGINNAGSYVTSVKLGEKICFDVSSFDNPDEGVTMGTTNLPEGASFSINNDLQQKGKFCWEPTFKDVGEHFFNVDLKDNNACGSEENTFKIQVNVICCSCENSVYYEKRSPSNNPLPEETTAGTMIVAGNSVDPSQNNGIVKTGSNDIKFTAPVVELEPGFEAGPGFETFTGSGSCTEECDVCCDDWKEFTLTEPPLMFSPNGDGKDDIWYIPDTENPTCAFGAQEFELLIKDRWGRELYSDQSFDNEGRCQFTAPGEDETGYSSINWDGTRNNGKALPNGIYFYTLWLKGCKENAIFRGTVRINGLNSSKSYELNNNDTIQNDLESDRFNEESNPNFAEKEFEKKIDIYPNPTNNIINITLSDSNSKIELITSEGKLLVSKQSKSFYETLDLSNLKRGIYIVRVISETKIHQEKVIKQ